MRLTVKERQAFEERLYATVFLLSKHPRCLYFKLSERTSLPVYIGVSWDEDTIETTNLEEAITWMERE
jgi:hypothetical protein